MGHHTDKSSPIIHFDKVGVNYNHSLRLFSRDSTWVLRNVDIDLYAGETLGIIGRNGAGKSTLMRLFADLITPDEGNIKRQNIDVLLLSLQVGFLPHLSGRENAILSGILLGMRRKEVEAKMTQIVEYAELEADIDHPVRTYSSGMRARLGFAIAVQADPDVLLIDEVLGVGDAKFREKSSTTLINLINSDRTVVIVSHSENTLKAHCDRVVWIEQGTTKMIGPTDEVLAAYAKSI